MFVVQITWLKKRVISFVFVVSQFPISSSPSVDNPVALISTASTAEERSLPLFYCLQMCQSSPRIGQNVAIASKGRGIRNFKRRNECPHLAFLLQKRFVSFSHLIKLL